MMYRLRGLVLLTRLLVVPDVLQRRHADDQVVRTAAERRRVLVLHARRPLVLVEDVVIGAYKVRENIADLECPGRIGCSELGQCDRYLDGTLLLHVWPCWCQT